MDERVETLPLVQRNAIVLRYLRHDKSIEGSFALMSAELAIGHMLVQENNHVDAWATG